MRSKLLMLGFVTAAYGSFLVGTLPASLALSYIDLPANIALNQVEGTVWQGQVKRISFNHIDVEDVRWDTSVMALLTGSAQVSIEFGRGKNSLRGSGELGYSSSGAYAQDFTASASSEWLIRASNAPLPVTTKGIVKLTIAELQQGQPWCEQLNGQLSWSNAAIESLLGNVEIDSAVADLSCDNGAIVANIKQGSKQLKLSGVAKLESKGKYSLSAVLVPSNELPESIRSNLRYIGKENAKGEYKINYVGRI
ncbi:type II secretion system protein N [Moritella sp. Urea-trap-13]|uniref:type II secretion system protein N n=1 Tax=Moritella sp. Urea-trap-13 TaxID=2058327 RepID=UPI000C339DA3|nr:type II secretion system protein N [Moritella sp. Urea-trap-13]PKH09111.1 general secretion pathway protein GspN [Moritella sp. Urea-trap-13]